MWEALMVCRVRRESSRRVSYLPGKIKRESYEMLVSDDRRVK